MARCARRTRSPSRTRRNRRIGRGLDRLQQSGLADARVALDEYRRPAPGPPAASSTPRMASSSRPRPTSGPGVAARNGIQGPMPASPRRMCNSTAVDWPRSTTAPRGSVASRPRAARRVASSSRISPGRAIDWMRAAVVIASPVRRRSPSAAMPPDTATTSPVASPMRTSRGSPSAAASWSPDRIASAARAARTASSSWARGQPKTANTASPMNFSRVPSNRSTAAAIVARAAVTRARTSSGSCSASIRT